MTTTTTLDRATIANLIGSVLRSKYPRQALPTIAANHDLTLAELQQVLKGHGYPDKDRMRQWQRKLLQADDADRAGLDVENDRVVDVDRTVIRRDPYVTALPVSDLFADPTYQRELDENRVRRMVDRYDPALVGILEVSKRDDGRYAILDGQHRWAAEKDHAFDSADRPHIACRVHSGLSLADEAKLYHQLNTTRKQLTGWDRWKARQSSSDPVVVAIETTAAAAGWTISYRSNTRGHLTATAACEKVHRLGGSELLERVLRIISAAWVDNPDGATAGIIHGLAHVLTSYDDSELETQRLVHALAGVVPRQLNARAAAAREVHKGTVDKLTAHVIVEQYNDAARAGRVAPFFAKVKPLSPNKGTRRAAEVQRAADLRAWALDTGLLVSERSHVTKEVREAYDAYLATATPSASGYRSDKAAS